MQEYVEQRNGGYYLSGSRIALDGIVAAFQKGAAPESILRSFPAIGSLVRVYGALTFYLENKALVDRYLREQSEFAESLRGSESPLPDGLAERIRMARQGTTPGRP